MNEEEIFRKKQIGILIIESVDILYKMIDLIEEIYLDDDSFLYGDYVTEKLQLENKLNKLLNK